MTPEKFTGDYQYFYLKALLLPLLTGGLGWIVVNLVINPWVELLKTRQLIYEKLILWMNRYPIPAPNTKDTNIEQAFDNSWNEIRLSIRDLAAKLESQVEVLPWWLKFYAELRFYDLKKAASNLIGLSNCTNRNERILHEDDILNSLQLPTRITKKQREHYLSRLDTGH